MNTWKRILRLGTAASLAVMLLGTGGCAAILDSMLSSDEDDYYSGGSSGHGITGTSHADNSSSPAEHSAPRR